MTKEELMGTNHHEERVEGGHFIVPAKVLRNVALSLFGLTVLTVFTAKFVHLGCSLAWWPLV